MATIQEELILYDKFSGTFTKYIRQANQAAGATSSAQKSVDRMTQSQKKAANATDGLAGSVRKLVAGYVGLQTISRLINLSDTITSTAARIDMMNDGLQTTAQLNDMIWQSAQRSRGLYTETANLVAQLGNLAGDAFSSSQEIVAFAEQINKQIALSGASGTAASAAILQLTQGLSSGALRGEELNSILEQTPTIAQAIAQYMGVTTGEMRELASQGAVTAEVVKNAMFAAAEETNAKFESMPMTWAQVWNQCQNIAIQALEPLLGVVSSFAQLVSNNIDVVIPVIAGLAAGLLFFAAATAIADAAVSGFFTRLLTNPLTWIAVAIGIVIALIVQWVQAVGGLQTAWLIVVDALMYGWDTVKAGFMTGVFFVMNLWDQLTLALATASTNIVNFMGQMKANVLLILQTMINGAIDLINWFIEKLNLLPGVAIQTIERVTFGTTAQLENEAATAARNQALTAQQQQVAQNIADRQAELEQMWADRDADHAARQQEIAQRQPAAAANSGIGTQWTTGNVGSYDPYSVETAANTGSAASSLSSIEKSVNMADEDLKNLVDMAERRYVNNINLQANTPVITVNGANTGRTQADRQALADTIASILQEQAAAGATRATAHAYSGG